MSLIKSICKALLTFFARAMIVGPTLDVPSSIDVVKTPVLIPAIVFSSVMILHWLIWQFIVPGYRLIGRDAKSLLIYPVPRDFFSGVIMFGYCSIALYSMKLNGYFALPTSSAELRAHLVFGLLLIGIGITARLRNVIFAIQSQNNSSVEQHPNIKRETLSDSTPSTLASTSSMNKLPA